MGRNKTERWATDIAGFFRKNKRLPASTRIGPSLDKLLVYRFNSVCFFCCQQMLFFG
jgi:hypothetical protein